MFAAALYNVPRNGAGLCSHGIQPMTVLKTGARRLTVPCRLWRLLDCDQQPFVHLITSMRTLPVLAMPMARAAPLLRSTARPFTNGPRSLIRTMMERPLREFVTRVPERQRSVGSSHRASIELLAGCRSSSLELLPIISGNLGLGGTLQANKRT